MRITVLGSGAWGSALGKILHDNGHDVTLWGINAPLLAELQQGRSERLLPGVKLPTGWKTASPPPASRGPPRPGVAPCVSAPCCRSPRPKT